MSCFREVVLRVNERDAIALFAGANYFVGVEDGLTRRTWKIRI